MGMNPNKKYERAVDSLIREAEAWADLNVRRLDFKNSETFAAAWNKEYHSKMMNLCRERGLRE